MDRKCFSVHLLGLNLKEFIKKYLNKRDGKEGEVSSN